MIEFIQTATLTDWFLILIFPVIVCGNLVAVYWLNKE
jgi:hypothetical protein